MKKLRKEIREKFSEQGTTSYRNSTLDFQMYCKYSKNKNWTNKQNKQTKTHNPPPQKKKSEKENHK